MQGKTLGAYRIESELGSGGMGTVWLATDDDHRYAIKVIHSHMLESPGFFKRFLREAEIGKAVRHPNVVRCYDADALVVDGRQLNFLVMEYVEGRTLRDLLNELERVPEELCCHIGREVAKGLAAIHEAGVVHRDLKPENVLITPEHQVKIMDLGVARLADEAIRLSQSGAFVGSIHYAAPEQFIQGGKDLDGRADLHALGLILYELSSGTHPYLADDVAQVLKRVLNDQPRRLGEINPQLSAFFEEVAHMLIAKDREKRFGSAIDLFRVLEKGEESTWWRGRAQALRAETKRPLRRIRIPRETAVYGREDELGKLKAIYEKAKRGDGQVVLIEGETGIGKSRLVDELVGRLRQEGEDLNFLFGSYPPGGAATAAGAWSTAYREQFGGDGSAPYLPETPVLVPAFDALLKGEPTPKGEQRLTKESIHAVFVHATRSLAAERPTIVLIEDLHFAPEEGIALFAALAMAASRDRLLLIGTARPTLPPEWQANLERLAHATRVGLARLGAKDLVSLLADALQSERLAEDLAGRIAVKSDGNPFFVFEILRGLREGQFISRRPDGTWVTTQEIREIEVPSSMQDFVRARISTLDDESRNLLEVSSCLGFEFDPLLVAAVLEIEPIPLLQSLSSLEKKQRLVHSAGAHFVFDHHQVQEILYDGIPESLRSEYHAAIGAVLKGRDIAIDRDPADLPGELAADLCDHFLKGGRGPDAVRYLAAALDHLEKGYLNDQAIVLTERALAHPELLTGPARAEILLRMATSLEPLGRIEKWGAVVAEVLELAKASEDGKLLWRAHQAVGKHFFVTSSYEEARGHFERQRAIARELGDRHGEGKAVSNLGNVIYQIGDYEIAREHYERWLSIAHETGDRAGEVSTMGNLGLLLLTQGQPAEARGQFERCLAIAQEIDDRSEVARATANIGLLLMSLGQYEEAQEQFESSRDITREIGERDGETYAIGNLGVVAQYFGRYEEAREHLERLLPMSRELGDRVGEATALVNLGPIHSILGDAAAGRRDIEECLSILEEIGDRRLQSYALNSLGEVELRAGNTEAARGLCEQAVALAREVGYPFALALALRELGGILASEGRTEEAVTCFEEARSLGVEHEMANTIVIAGNRLAMLGAMTPAAAVSGFEEHDDRLGRYERMEAVFLLWQATDDAAHLEHAHHLLCYVRDHAPEEYRETMITNVPLHRDIMAAWE